MESLDYGVIGNCKSAALISKKGSLDWCCLPNFNSPSVFAKLLDLERGGVFEFVSDSTCAITQKYIAKTNILKTRFEDVSGTFEVIDFMPRYHNGNGGYYAPPDIIRYVRLVSGNPIIRINYDPRLNYAKHKTKTIINGEYIKSYTSKGSYDSVYLYTDLDMKKVVEGEPIDLKSDCYFLLSYNQKLLEQNCEKAYLKYERTKVYWLNWSERTKKFAKYNDEINRSALVLKVLSYDKTGAILAALTTSLPETVGEVRNWDYRFCWIRDASMAIKVLTYLGHTRVAKRFLNFILDIVPMKDEKIQIMYGIHGEKKLTEVTLDHLNGYKNSKPVRVGNEAYKQKQNDIYGVLMDVIYQHFKIYDTSLENSEELWTITRSIIKNVKHNWKKPDRGIWEIRNEHKHFTFSKVLCWVAMDRGLKIARLLNRSEYFNNWRKVREEIKADILKNAWDPEKKAFTQAYNNNDMDASNLLMESYGFIDAKDPKYVSTVRCIEKELKHKGLMFRYKNNDDFGKPTSAFTICAFWLVNALYKIGDKKEAETMFHEILEHTNDHGILSEDMDFDTRRLLGNFPQAYSHLALIETAVNISEGEVSEEEMMLEAIHQ
jgi:GH15 family glucan-1,4-alpha-glucosidase